ncbi:pancreatic lipase-related protein 2 [Patella vulgata]|uniref:pancreatic lipase-related protein 2 n=1 Tax=Patella vulgata TaxID=6465 RepID=UPI00218099AE|nr:pancreatic lipase-related protein 2 [Patella vulgata]
MFLCSLLQFSVLAGFVSCILSAESADIIFHEDATLRSNIVINHQAVIHEEDAQPPNAAKPTPKPTTPDPRANKSICYKELGCFDNFYPFNNADLDLPDSPKTIGTSMTLYTRQNRQNGTGQLLQYNNKDTIKHSYFDGSKPTKIIIHGLANNLNTAWLHELKDELLKRGDFNIIIVGWGNGAKVEDYSKAVANTRVVATVVHRTIGLLLTFGAKLDKIHLVGHSLGAHTSGYVGHLFKGALQRITGLDPAGPNYDHSPILVVLDHTDAKFVDIIHSNAAPFLSGGAGLLNQSGHVDFYLNGGKHQPGCKDGFSGISELLHGHGISQTLGCSHGRSHIAFIESVNSRCPFTAYPCSDYDRFEAGKCLNCGSTGCSVLGYYSDQYYARGKMYLNTSPNSPLCGYHYSVTIKGAQETKDSKGTISIRLKGNWGDSGFVLATQEDQTLKRGDTFSHILVSPIEVGDVDSLTIKYEQYPGTMLFGFGKGEDKYAVDSVEVIAGENGDKFKFCLVNNKELMHDTEVKAVKSSAQHRC